MWGVVVKWVAGAHPGWVLGGGVPAVFGLDLVCQLATRCQSDMRGLVTAWRWFG